jgi:hypothetical protein
MKLIFSAQDSGIKYVRETVDLKGFCFSVKNFTLY